MDGSTVTVLLRVFAGIDVRVTLDGRDPEQVNTPVPVLEFAFLDVRAGTHTIRVSDVVGFSETTEVLVSVSDAPEWLNQLITRLENEPVANLPASVTSYEYKGRTVYFVPAARCCYFFSDLLALWLLEPFCSSRAASTHSPQIAAKPQALFIYRRLTFSDIVSQLAHPR